jgi:hypothetical protein
MKDFDRTYFCSTYRQYYGGDRLRHRSEVPEPKQSRTRGSLPTSAAHWNKCNRITASILKHFSFVHSSCCLYLVRQGSCWVPTPAPAMIQQRLASKLCTWHFRFNNKVWGYCFPLGLNSDAASGVCRFLHPPRTVWLRFESKGRALDVDCGEKSKGSSHSEMPCDGEGTWL